jgi:AcrR family transcriptional regulator
VTTTTRTRLRPDARREQLLDLGAGLLATRSIDELTVELLAEEAGTSRGLLYHYFGSKQGFHEAVVRHAAAALVEALAPPEGADPLARLRASIGAYVDYAVANHAGYRSLVKAAAGGNDALRAVYDETLAAIEERFFAEDPGGELVPDRPDARLVVRAWQAYAEELVLSWCEDPHGIPRDRLVDMLAGSLPAVVATLPDRS